ELLEEGDFEEATVPLKEAARQAPEKSSVREALGRALFRSRHYAEAATEFEAVVETHPLNDYAPFCLGGALTQAGATRRAARATTSPWLPTCALIVGITASTGSDLRPASRGESRGASHHCADR